MEFHATIHEEDGSYWAEVPELPGCFASGKDLNELEEALIEAIGMCLTEKEHAQMLAEVEADVHHQLRVGGITVATGPLVPA
jgi:predicted RNase H-like HicB family nuclease